MRTLLEFFNKFIQRKNFLNESNAYHKSFIIDSALRIPQSLALGVLLWTNAREKSFKYDANNVVNYSILIQISIFLNKFIKWKNLLNVNNKSLNIDSALRDSQ